MITRTFVRPRNVRQAGRLLLATTALAGLGIATPATADTPNWTGTLSRDWITPGNWSGHHVPNASSKSPAGVNSGSGIWNANAANFAPLDVPADPLISLQSGFAIFDGAGGTITVDDSAAPVTVTGIQFNSDGYTIAGDAVTLSAPVSVIRVGNGTAASAAFSATIEAPLTGTAQLDKDDLGTLILTGANTYTGGTTISDGTLQLGNGGTSGSITGDVTDNGVLVFDRSDSASLAGKISGAGAVAQNGVGTTTLTGNNNYSGGTTIAAGSLIGSATSLGSGAILDNAALIIDQGSDAVFTNPLNGTGTFEKRGTGSLNMTGTSTLTGGTAVSADRLAVNGAMAGSIVTVKSGATFGGNGTVGGVIAQSGAIVGPGNSIGVLNVAGNYSAASGSVYAVELDSGGQADKIVATGTATIASGAKLVVTKTDAAPYVLGTRYTVLTAAGGVAGAYDLSGDVSPLGAFLGLVASYDAKDVYLDVAKVNSFASAGGTSNEVVTGAALDTVATSNGAVSALLSATDIASARRALNQLSGEAHASVGGMLVENSRFVRDAVLGRLEREGDGRSAIWGQALGNAGSSNGDGNAAAIDRNAAGLAMGFDFPIAGHFRFGGLAGYTRDGFDIDRRGSSGSSKDYHLAAYGLYEVDKTILRAGAAYSWNNVRVDRAVSYAGFNDRLKSRYNGGTAQVFGELGYQVSLGTTRLEPYANIAWVSLATDAFGETGGAAALTGKRYDQQTAFSTTGLRASARYLVAGDQYINFQGALGWRHACNDVIPTSTLAFAGGQAFSVTGNPVTRDAVTVDVGLDAELSNRVRLGASYNGQFARGTRDSGIKVNLSIAFE